MGTQAVLKYYCGIVGALIDSQLTYLSVHRGLIAEAALRKRTEMSLHYEPNFPNLKVHLKISSSCPSRKNT